MENSRRRFIKNISLYGASLELVPALSLNRLLNRDKQLMTENEYFTVYFNNTTGHIDILRRNGIVLMSNITSRVNTGNGRISNCESEYRHSAEIQRFSDKIGSGNKLIIRSASRGRGTSFITGYSIYDKSQCIIIDAGFTNNSGKDIVVRSIEPVCATEETGAFMNWNTEVKVLTNGPMYYDAGMIHKVGDDFREPDPYGPVKGSNPIPDFRYPSPERIRSWWNIGVFSGYDKEALVCGFPDNQDSFGQLILSKNSNGMFSLYTESIFAEGRILQSGHSVQAGRFLFNIGTDPFSALETFSETMGLLNGIRNKSIVNGWCSWFYTYEFVTEDEVLRNTEYVSKNLRKYGLDYIQIDEGYQKFHGEWEGNERFPHGMKWLAGRIKEYGLKPGIWVAPYIISEPTMVYRDHPDWLLKKADGSLMRVGPWPDENTDWAKNETPKRYGLDISHPEAKEWFYGLFNMIGNDWGYEMVKIDFVAWSILSAGHFYDNTYTPAKAYREGMQLIRKALGDKKHINDCGPGPVTAGLIDSMRIEIDQNYGYADAVWKQYFADSSSSGPAMAKRYYFNNRSWINDADHVCLGMLSLAQARSAATLIGMSGGNIISGDRLTDLDESRLEILKKIMPSYGEAAKPSDLFDSDRPSVFALRVSKPYGDWTVVGIFNSDRQNKLVKSIPLSILFLDQDKTYLVYDFWQESYLGEVTGTLDAEVLPGSVTLLSFHEKRGIPQLISTDRHILQGAVETEDVTWEESSKTLKGVSKGFAGIPYNIIIHVPDSVSWKQGQGSLFRDYKNFSVRQVAPQIIKVRLFFSESDKCSWELVLSGLEKITK